jgi:hypothetical protein
MKMHALLGKPFPHTPTSEAPEREQVIGETNKTDAHQNLEPLNA